jgi:hypothetical protein
MVRPKERSYFSRYPTHQHTSRTSTIGRCVLQAQPGLSFFFMLLGEEAGGKGEGVGRSTNLGYAWHILVQKVPLVYKKAGCVEELQVYPDEDNIRDLGKIL